MQARASHSAARLTLPSARCAPARPQAAHVAYARRQRAAGRWHSASGRGGGAAVGRQLVACRSSGGGTSSMEDLITATYDLGPEAITWLQAWHNLSIAPPADPAAVSAQLGQLLQEFAGFTPEQKWQVAWTQLQPDWRRYLVFTHYAASSEAELVHKAASDHAVQQQADSLPPPPLPVQLVLAAACSRCMGWAAGPGGAGGEGQAAIAAAAAAAMDSRFGVSGGAAEFATPQQRAMVEATSCLIGSLLLQWFGWKQAAGAGWALPAVPWRGGTVAAVLAASLVAHALLFAVWSGLEESTWPDRFDDGDEFLVELWGRSFTFRAAHHLSALAAIAGILWALVLRSYPHALSQGLLTAWLQPLQSWLPTVAALGALQACLLLLKGAAASKCGWVHGAVLHSEFGMLHFLLLLGSLQASSAIPYRPNVPLAGF